MKHRRRYQTMRYKRGGYSINQNQPKQKRSIKSLKKRRHSH